jgi:hypothetical protein
LQAWSGPEGSRKLRFPDFMTSYIFLLLHLTGDRVITWLHSPAKGSEHRRKVKVIKEKENGTADMLLEFVLVNSTIQMIWKNGTKIVSAFEQNKSRIKRF